MFLDGKEILDGNSTFVMKFNFKQHMLSVNSRNLAMKLNCQAGVLLISETLN